MKRLFYWSANGDAAGDCLGFHFMRIPAFTYQNPSFSIHLHYVIVHELCHTIEKSHSKVFWNLVAQDMPNWQQSHIFMQTSIFGNDV